MEKWTKLMLDTKYNITTIRLLIASNQLFFQFSFPSNFPSSNYLINSFHGTSFLSFTTFSSTNHTSPFSWSTLKNNHLFPFNSLINFCFSLIHHSMSLLSGKWPISCEQICISLDINCDKFLLLLWDKPSTLTLVVNIYCICWWIS